MSEHDDVHDAELVDHPEPGGGSSSVPAQSVEVAPAGVVVLDLTLPPAPAFDYTDAGVPTLDYVRSRIEGQLGTAQGAAELAGEAQAAKARADREAERDRLAQERLAEIRRSLGR